MMRIYLFIPLLAVGYLSGQNSQLYYSGNFQDTKGKAKNFLKVYNKNSGIYELTDEKGFAIIAAKPFDTLAWNNGKNIHVVYSYQLRELKAILEGHIDKKQVEEIQSKAYDSLVSKEKRDHFSVENTQAVLSKNSVRFFENSIKLKQKRDNTYKIKNIIHKDLVFNGSFTTAFTIRNRNAIAKTQNRYVQGRSENGNLVWKDPETDEMLSFGPDISGLAFDGHPYEYDQNGRLVPISNGLHPAKGYHNDIFKTTVGYYNQLNVNALIKQGYQEKARLAIDLGQQKDQMYFADQFNILNSFKAKLSTNLNGYTLDATFNYEENKTTNTNRIGLFNRIYQNSLLTPISFSNGQRLLLNDGSQRRYSRFADNPLFLFNGDDQYPYRSTVKQWSLNASKTWDKIKVDLSQSYENTSTSNEDQYRPSTYGFEYGIFNERAQNNRLYHSNLMGTYSLGDYDFKNTFSFNFILNDIRTDISNSLTGKKNVYQRTSQDHLFNYSMLIRNYDFEAGVNLGNSLYISNTSDKNNYWLPKANAYITFNQIFNWRNYSFKLLGSYTQLSSEPDLTRSYASYATTLLKAENGNRYFPVHEVESFKGLSPIHTTEWKAGAKLNFNYNISIEGEYFNRKIKDDIFPVFENDRLVLKNLADHTYSGYELNFVYDRLRLGNDFWMTHKISFFKYRDWVDRVNAGYNNSTLSGFSDIYKSLTEGQALGSIMGSYFKRTTDGRLIIDESGFPEKAAGMKIIADPTPDFVMKFNHNFSYKMLSLDINWEWKKGGQLWNGTQAALDYYGRSYNSGEERNIKNYVFEGVHINGSVNQIPVDFYDPNKNVQQNRWLRYGFAGVAEDYIQKADYIRINSISLSTTFRIHNTQRSLKLSVYVNNIMLWQANTGVDSNQSFYDTDNGRGLDFFNLPSFKTFGCIVSFKF